MVRRPEGERLLERIQVKVFWAVTPFSAAVGYQTFGGFSASIFRFSDVGILSQNYTVSQPSRHHRGENFTSCS